MPKPNRTPDHVRLTAGEKTRLAWLVARMAKRGLADPDRMVGTVDLSDLQRRADRIYEQAARRQEAAAKNTKRK
ncbi:DUF6257 family protein [Streptomyces sp. NPDC049906]|uniref:DUF6257 family protein n=1 Tax=Streptomyces sp. NPDC049906 TaxID=3155656 RepID=UPI00343E88FF